MQVMEQLGREAGPSKQAVLACQLAHPHLVQGYCCASRPRPGPVKPGGPPSVWLWDRTNICCVLDGSNGG